MSFSEINAYLEVMQEKEENDLKLDLTMKYYQARMTMAKEPYRVYKDIYNQMFKRKSKEMTEEQMKQVSKQFTIMLGGKIIKPIKPHKGGV